MRNSRRPYRKFIVSHKISNFDPFRPHHAFNYVLSSWHLVGLVKLPKVEVQRGNFDHVFLGDLFGKVGRRQVLDEPRFPLGLSGGNKSI